MKTDERVSCDFDIRNMGPETEGHVRERRGAGAWEGGGR